MDSSDNKKMLLILISATPGTGKTTCMAELEKQIPNSKGVDAIYPTGERMQQMKEACRVNDYATLGQIVIEMDDGQLAKIKALADEGKTKVVFMGSGVRPNRQDVQDLLAKCTDYRPILVRLCCSLENGMKRVVERIEQEKLDGVSNELHSDSEIVITALKNMRQAMEHYGEEDHIVIDCDRPLEEVVAELKALVMKNLEV